MMNKNPKNVIPFLFLFIFACPICSINFLLFLIGTNQFERNTFEFLAQELARRGHKVVTVKSILIPEEPQLVKPLLHLVHEKVLKDVLPQRLFVPLERVGEDVPWRENYEVEAYMKPYWAAHVFACQRMLNSNLMNILAQEQLELAILYSGNPCQQGIAMALGIPFVVVDLDGLTDQTLVAAGAAWDNLPKEIIFPPPSFLSIPNFIFRRFIRSFSLARESLAQSGIPSIALSISERYRQLEYPIWLQFQSNPEFRRKFRNGFPQLNLGNAELLLANTDPLLESPSFSFCPSRLLPIGGIHIDSIRPLFAPWNESIANSQFGTILVSLGTQANTNSMPEKLVRAFLYAFRHLANYRIFWRISPKLTLSGFNSTQIDKLAMELPNLNITTFFPQNELLAHPRTQLLITNGGIHSLMEAMHWGVPVLGIPLYGQNLANLEKVKMKGFGTWIGKNEAKDGEKLIGAIKMVLGNSRFTRNAKDLGREIRSRPSSPMQNILHAFESIVRRQRLNPANSKERKSSPTLSFIFRLNIDIFLIFIIFVTLFYGIGCAALKLVLLCFCWPISTILAKFTAIMTVKATILGIGKRKYGNGRGKEGLKEE